ncbi:uncharacterized protein BP5553_10196 [Venustampulla echinocandica]|uniref:Glycine zipper 2TM domain-containing protein n=1 Tax=Venustampulla echinocandica TaxID=2656787 RepID=A0A370TAN9_9HELO|nr:uncharacterized protein BP5553_10196 [Venustampulla echinocandica]RDL30851.1 hypothetical protein BP5553_10196 [Venustampulla echinocandica]
MSSLDKLFRRKSHMDGPPNANSNGANKPSDAATLPVPRDAQVTSNATAARQGATAPVQPPPPQGAGRSYPQTQSQMQNTGMMAGGAVGMMGGDGGNAVDGMLVGGVVGGMVGQRLAQAENHAYWSGQAMEYRQRLAAGEQPPAGDSAAKGTSWWSREGRQQRRMKRWERRAKRRDGTVVNVNENNK